MNGVTVEVKALRTGRTKSRIRRMQTRPAAGPVNIAGARIADLPAIQFEYKPSALHIINNGHKIEIEYAPGSFIGIGDRRYELGGVHTIARFFC
jgi:carbonic anhydrase